MLTFSALRFLHHINIFLAPLRSNKLIIFSIYKASRCSKCDFRYNPFRFIVACDPLKMVAVNFCYAALAGLIRHIHQMEKHTSEQTRSPTILYQEVRMPETRLTFVKFGLFFAGLSFLFNLLAVGSHILSTYSMSAMLLIAK